ncbi:MAG: LysM domain [Verrucomicrobiota bacterium]|jgi:LysM repeat protein
MKLPKLLTRKKLRATTARRALGVPDDMDYEEMSEPNMKLSRALLIVLVLHVVAVAGIIAFNTIKSRQGPLPFAPAQTKHASTTSDSASVKSDGPAVTTTDLTAARKEDSIPTRVATKAGPKEDKKSDKPKPTESAAPKIDPAKTYVVAKGDNPASIARKLKVTQAALMAANDIDDPHKLKIGQKLTIPAKKTKPKKSSE